MVLTLKVPLKQAEKWKKFLMDTNNFYSDYKFDKDDDFIYYPIKEKFEVLKSSISFVEKSLDNIRKRKSLRDSLSEKLTKQEMEIVQTAQDTIGDIAIIEIPSELESREVEIAQTLLTVNSQIKTVLKKAASHEGVFRTQKMKFLAGVDTRVANYKENGVILKVDVENVYFSPRLSTERLRISKKIKPGEKILVMFSGCAPYPIVISKNTNAKHIIGIEINPQGHKLGLENVKLNKIKNVDLYCGDVKKVIPQLLSDNPELVFDRIIMPLPKTADEFLRTALLVSKTGTIIHFYDFLEENNFDEAKNKVAKACMEDGLEYKFLELVKCGQHAPRVFRICLDFQIL